LDIPESFEYLNMNDKLDAFGNLGA